MDKKLLCFYGDDFTGSTDVLESLSSAGLKTVLFLSPPTRQLLEERFADIQCFGLAGVSRSMSPEEMASELPDIYTMMKESGAAVVHYKVCSTFDSSSRIGSIGKAIDIGREVLGDSRYIPLLVGVPYLGRYTLFGNHFAAGGPAIHRLDRHPTMSRHPVTPMDEADIRLHLGRQTDASTELFNILDLEGSAAKVQERIEQLLEEKTPDIVLFDVLDSCRLETAGSLIWKEAERSGGGLFTVGSSGIEYALTAHWKNKGIIPKEAEKSASAGSVEQLLVVSGSCSPVTDSQIAWALSHGFEGIRIPVQSLIRPETSERTRKALLDESLRILNRGSSLILYSASGPQDNSIEEVRQELASRGLRSEDTGKLLGQQLGLLSHEIVSATSLKRMVVAGGDTSGYVTRELGIYALECLAAIAPGGPLCRTFSEIPRFNGLQLALKGGQVGPEDYFYRVLQGE